MTTMQRRRFLESLGLAAGGLAVHSWPALGAAPAKGSGKTVSTLIGTGAPGFSDTQVANPYGMAIGPDKALYFCDLDNQRIRRLNLTTHQITTVAGDGRRTYGGDGGPALAAALNMPHEVAFDRAGDLYIAERDNHVIRKVAMKTGVISTVAGKATAGFSGDGGPAVEAELRQPHSIAFDRRGALLICDIGNHRIRRVQLDTGIIDTFAGNGEHTFTPDGAPVHGTPVNGPRTMAVASNGDIYLALREGNAIYRIAAKTETFHRVAGTGQNGYAGDGGAAVNATLNGPKGLAYASAAGLLYIADTESHVIRSLNVKTGVLTTVMGTGERGDGPEPDPRRCKLSRPHGVLAAGHLLYVSDSESHRIRLLK